MKEKTFYKILIEFTSSIDKTKKSLSDRRLTNTEKLIIEGHLNIRKNLNQEVLATPGIINASESPFVESQRLLLIGSALNNLSKFREAEKYLLQAIEISHKIKDPFFTFYSYHVLFTIYDNLHWPHKMLEAIEAMKKVSKTKRQEVQLLICEFCYDQITGNFKSAEQHLEKINQRLADLTEGDLVRQLVNKFIFHVTQKDLTRARTTLKELKQCRNYHLTENYNFMKKMLDNLIDGTPLYIYEHQFQKVPVLFHQIKTIQYLEEKNPTLAQAHWTKLQEDAPEIYQDKFHYAGPTCLFSLGLEKYLIHAPPRKGMIDPQGDTKLDQLASIFHQTTSSLSAAQLYELLWEDVPETKEDIKKVSRLVSRLKTERSLDISFHKGTYQLVSRKDDKAS